MVFALAGDSTMTSGLPPAAEVRRRGVRSLVGDFVVLVGGTVLLSGGAGAGAGTDPDAHGTARAAPDRRRHGRPPPGGEPARRGEPGAPSSPPTADGGGCSRVSADRPPVHPLTRRPHPSSRHRRRPRRSPSGWGGRGRSSRCAPR